MVQVIVSVAAGADDGHIDGSSFFNTSTSLYAGKAGAASQNMWFRFDGITVPKNAVITSAYLRLYFESHPSDDPPGANAGGFIAAEDADDPAAFDSYSGGSDPWTGRTATSATVSWPLSLSWSDGSSQDSPDIKTVVQELVNRAGWASGQAMLLWWEDSGSGSSDEWQFASYESASTEPKLEINYTTDVDLEAAVAASGSVTAPLFVDPKELAAAVAALRRCTISAVISTRSEIINTTPGTRLRIRSKPISSRTCAKIGCRTSSMASRPSSCIF